jgi:hypothetical protein
MTYRNRKLDTPTSIGRMTARLLVALLAGLAWHAAIADENGMSFWLPGQFGSFAALPSHPGWSLPLVAYHSSGEEGSSKVFPRGGRFTTGLDLGVDLLIAVPTYTLASPVAGGRASVGVTTLLGHVNVGIDATLSGPGGGALLSGGESDSRTGVGDLYPTASLKWSSDAHNFMTYAMAGVPVGAYDKGRLANIGTNHWSLDAGGGYTYLDTKRGHELSAVLGFTYNLENPDTDYKNGVSAHLDWAASQFFSRSFHLGLVGYFYHQLTGDSGAGAVLGDFKSKVSAVGPQAGWFLKVDEHNWYLNLKGYWELDAENRPEGWNLWVTLAIPLGSAK